jgi:hypothetical protein
MSRLDGQGAAPGGEAVAALLSGLLGDPEAAWSLGSFGALAEFVRDAEEAWVPLVDGRLGLATGRGAIALTPVPGLRPLAYETAFTSGWNHAIALCLPEESCAMAGRDVVTELGPDAEAGRPEDRGAILFDLGLGLRAVDACVRTADPETLACLRAGLGRPLFAPGSPTGPGLVGLSPHRVFVTRIGRIEVFTPIPGADAASPEGPHTHILPKLLLAGRTHAATTPIPAGFVPCGAIHPAHPTKDALGRRIPFRPDRYAAFQRLLDAWGEPGLVAAKRAAEAGDEPPAASGLRGRDLQAARRAAAVQAAFLRGEAPVPSASEETDEERGHV